MSRKFRKHQCPICEYYDKNYGRVCMVGARWVYEGQEIEGVSLRACPDFKEMVKTL